MTPKQKHTPWRSEPCTSGFRAPDAGDFQIVAENMICPGTVWGHSGFKEGEANAHLIAAAPDMLAALKLIEKSLSAHNRERREDSEEAHCGWDFGEGFGGGLDAVRAAIAKATGSAS